jgi:predicted cupin superfamily sugar epimerase
MSRAINASTEVKPEGSNDMVKAFTAAYSMAIKGHLSGYEWTNYPRDRVAIWNAGGSLAIHLLYPDGHHERVVLGDARHNHDAQYKVVVPPGVWEASELLEGDYVLMTIGVAPELDMSLFKTYDVERVVSDFPQYEQLIRRLDKIREHDVAMDFSHTSYDQELRHGESGRPHYGGYRSQDGHRPSGHHEYDNDRRSHHDNLRSQNSYDRQHDNYGNQYDNYGHQYDNYGRQYDNNRRQYDNSGRRHGGNGHSDDEIRSLAHELGIHRVSYEDKGIFYMSETNYSTTDVKPEGSDNLVPSFESTYVMYIKGQFSGYNWTNYQRDRVAVWNAGGIIALHMLYPDGRHERVLLGDVKHNHEVHYRVVVPHGVWEASEIIEGDYALITFVAAPALDHSLFKPYSVDEVAHEFPAYENMIRRLDRIGSHDVPYDFSQKSHGYPDHRRYGGDHSQGRYGQDGHLSSRGRHELRSLAQELGIHPVGIANYGTFYHSAFYNSSTEVMPEGDSKMVHAFTSSYAMFIQGHFSGYQWNNYPRDRVNIWNAGGSVALHMLHPDGHHERVILGDVEHNHEAQYRVVIPAGVWVASELIEGDYVLVTYVAAPAMDLSLFQNYNVEDVVSEFSQYENMIRRLDNIREHDVLLDMSQTSHDEYGQSGHRYEYDDNSRYNQDNQRSHHQGGYSYGGYGRGQSSHPDQYNDNHRYNQYNQRSHNQGRYSYGGYGHTQSSHRDEYDYNHKYNQYNQRAHNQGRYSYGGYGRGQSSHPDQYDDNHRYNQYNQRSHNQGGDRYGGFGRGQSSHPDQYDDNHIYNQYNQRSHNANHYDNRNDNRFDNRYDNRYDNHYDNQFDNRYDNRYDNHYYNRRSNHQ